MRPGVISDEGKGNAWSEFGTQIKRRALPHLTSKARTGERFLMWIAAPAYYKKLGWWNSTTLYRVFFVPEWKNTVSCSWHLKMASDKRFKNSACQVPEEISQCYSIIERFASSDKFGRLDKTTTAVLPGWRCIWRYAYSREAEFGCC